MKEQRARIMGIQQRLGLTADGIIGPATLSAIERLLDAQQAVTAPMARITCSLAGLKQLIHFEISSPAYYHRNLKRPTWPGGESGVTVGIGYDLGYQSPSRFRGDWRGLLPDSDIAVLESTCRLRGESAKQATQQQNVQRVEVVLNAAERVFYQASLPRYGEKLLDAYPGVQDLPPDAQSAMLSLIYNRGTRKSGSTRREMKALETLVQTGDLGGIAEQILAMKRLWEGRGLDGLLRRREIEAGLVLGADRAYDEQELVVL